MIRRYCAAAFAAAAVLTAASGQDKPAGFKPMSVLQVQPLGKILADVKEVAKAFGGGDAVEQFDEKLKEKLGEKGFAGLDLKRPVVGAQLASDDVEKPAFLVLVPVTGEKEFLDLLDRAGVEVEPSKGDKTLLQITPPDNANLDGPVYLRVKGDTAYFGVNTEAATLDAKALPAAAAVALEGETAWFVAKTFVKDIPKEFRAKSAEAIDKAAGQFDALPIPPAVKERIVAAMKVGQKYNDLQADQGDTATARLNLDPKTLVFSSEYVLVPRAGTKLAADLSARKATTNRFAGLLPAKDTAIGFATRLPLVVPELREGAAELIAFGKSAGMDRVPEPLQAAAEAALDGVARTAKSGDFDLAAGLTGPNADGKFALAVGVSFDDPAKLEAELRKLHADADDQVKSLIKLDAAKVGKVGVHKANVGAFFPPEVQAVFGDEATVAFAFAPKGIVLTVGTKSVEQLKALVPTLAEPVDTPVLDVKLNPSRLRQLADARGDDNMKALFPEGVKDELKSVAQITVTGGKDLTARLVVNLKAIPKPPAE